MYSVIHIKLKWNLFIDNTQFVIVFAHE